MGEAARIVKNFGITTAIVTTLVENPYRHQIIKISINENFKAFTYSWVGGRKLFSLVWVDAIC